MKRKKPIAGLKLLYNEGQNEVQQRPNEEQNLLNSQIGVNNNQHEINNVIRIDRNLSIRNAERNDNRINIEED